MGCMIDRDGVERKTTIEKEVKQYEHDRKEIVLQKVNVEGWGSYLRIAYKHLGDNGKWNWVRNSPLLREEDLMKLLEKAKKEGII